MHVQSAMSRPPQALLCGQSLEMEMGELPRGFKLPDQVAAGHSAPILKKQDGIFPALRRSSGEPSLKVANVSQIHGADDDVWPTVFVQITRCHQIPLTAGGDGKCIWLKFVPTGVLQKHDAPFGMSCGIRKIAGDQNIEIAILVKISHLCPGSAVHGEKVPFDKIVLAVIFQDPDSVVRLEHTGIVEIVAVHIQDIQLAVAVEIMHGEVHRAIHRGKPRQDARRCGKPPAAIILEQLDPLITLRE